MVWRMRPLARGKGQDVNLRRLLDGVHQAEGGVKVRAGDKQPVVGPHTAASYSFISWLVARAMSLPPGTIQGTTPTPPGNTTGHSVALFHKARVKSRAVRGKM